jgi:pimeloyl-ACP methyl ester carboxylesterase
MEPYKTPKGWHACCSCKHQETIKHQEALLAGVENLTSGLVKLSNGKDFINTILIDNSKESHKDVGKTLVLTHGFGAGFNDFRLFPGLAFFHRNLADIQKSLPGWKIYAIDWLGMANSSRPSFPNWKDKASERDNVTGSLFFI